MPSCDFPWFSPVGRRNLPLAMVVHRGQPLVVLIPTGNTMEVMPLTVAFHCFPWRSPRGELTMHGDTRDESLHAVAGHGDLTTVRQGESRWSSLWTPVHDKPWLFGYNRTPGRAPHNNYLSSPANFDIFWSTPSLLAHLDVWVTKRQPRLAPEPEHHLGERHPRPDGALRELQQAFGGRNLVFEIATPLPCPGRGASFFLSDAGTTRDGCQQLADEDIGSGATLVGGAAAQRAYDLHINTCVRQADGEHANKKGPVLASLILCSFPLACHVVISSPHDSDACLCASKPLASRPKPSDANVCMICKDNMCAISRERSPSNTPPEIRLV